MDEFYYQKSIERDSIEQFRNQPNIQILHDVLAKQLQDVYDFFCQLNNGRDIFSARIAIHVPVRSIFPARLS